MGNFMQRIRLIRVSWCFLQVTIEIDNQQFEQEFNENQPVPRIITPGGVIFIGGMANVRKHTNGQSTDNYEGTIKTVRVNLL